MGLCKRTERAYVREQSGPTVCKRTVWAYVRKHIGRIEEIKEGGGVGGGGLFFKTFFFSCMVPTKEYFIKFFPLSPGAASLYVVPDVRAF